MAASQALPRRLRCRSLASSFAHNIYCRTGSPLHPPECGSTYRLLTSTDSRSYTTDMSTPKGSKKILFVDTHAFVRRLESQGLTAMQAEAITTAVMEVLNDSINNVSQSFASKPDMQKIEMVQESTLAKLKLEIQNAQEYKMSLIQRDIERIRTDVEKMRSDLRYEIDKVTAAQRLDINLERGRTRDDLSKQSAETTELTSKLDREIHALKTQVEAAKYEVIKYGIGTIVSLTALGLGLLRILM